MSIITARDIAAGHPHMANPDAVLAVPYGRRVRANAGGRWVIDAEESWVAWLPGGPPVPRWAFAADDVDAEWLARLDADAARRVELNHATAGDIELVVIADASVADAWFEEDEQVHVHPRDPFGRVEVRASSRRVVVRVGETVVARTDRPLLVFETGLPTRHYLPRVDVREHFLFPSETRTACPYKGIAHHFHLDVDGRRIEDGAWSYPLPRFELPQLTDHVCFYEDRVSAIDISAR